MFDGLRNYLLRKEIRKNTVKKQFVPWDKIQSAVILVSAEQLTAELNSFIKDSGKDVYIVVFHNDLTSKTNGCFLSVNEKDFNFFDLPRPEVAEKIKSKAFDVLINTDFKNTGPMKVVSGLIPAKFKIGPQGAYDTFFDISIKSS